MIEATSGVAERSQERSKSVVEAMWSAECHIRGGYNPEERAGLQLRIGNVHARGKAPENTPARLIRAEGDSRAVKSVGVWERSAGG